MENISLHIEYLLLKHDCVIVPGIGAFINAYRAARYDAKQDIFLPPASEVRFNSEITEDDGLLANSYSRKYRIQFAESRDIVRNESEGLRNALQRDREITLGNLGILSLDGSDIISFNPFSRMDSINDRFGLKSLHMAKEIAVKEEKADNTHSDVRKENGNTKSRKLDFEKNYYIPVNKIFAKTAACLLLIATLTISLLLPSSEKVKEDRASVFPVDSLIKNAKNNISNQISSSTETNKSDTLPSLEAAASFPESTPSEKLPYQLIVGTFSNESDAESYVEIMKKEGYDLRNIPSRRLHRVSAAGAEEPTELYKILNDKDFSKHFTQAWVWHNPIK